MRPREVLVLCCVHSAQSKIHPAIYTILLTFCQTAEGNKESKGS